MNRIKYFFECYFNQSYYFDELDKLIDEHKKTESYKSNIQFIVELHQIIRSKRYTLASRIIKKYGFRTLNLSETEQLIKYIYNKLTDQPAYINRSIFVKDCKVIFCPVCCPDPEKPKFINLIQKATIIANNQQIYICRPCKLMWLDENNIRSNNAQAYKTFMKSLGLKGTWKELTNIDVL